jgi:hypothetical protein
MNVGELGNFISYAFAPASVVAPLGAVSSINSNVLLRVLSLCHSSHSLQIVFLLP